MLLKNYDIRYDFVYQTVTDFILEENITLPVLDIFKLCKRLNILVLSDEEIKTKFDLSYCKMLNTDDEATIYLSETDQYIIIYNTKVQNDPLIKFTIGHELAHIILGYFDSGYDSITYQCEKKESEYFLMLLLMHPLYLLRNCVDSDKEVQSLCQTTAMASSAGFINFKNFCRLHVFKDTDLHLLSQINKNI